MLRAWMLAVLFVLPTLPAVPIGSAAASDWAVLPVARETWRAPAFIVLGDDVYAAGGTVDGSPTDLVYKATLGSNGPSGWAASTPLPARQEGRGFGIGGKLIVAGGPGEGIPCNGARAFIGTPLPDGSVAWARGRDMPAEGGGGGPTFANVGARVYVTGSNAGSGCSGYPSPRVWTTTFQDGDFGPWTQVRDLPGGINWGSALVAHGGWLYVLGGGVCCGGSQSRASTYRASIGEDGTLGEWMPGPSLPRPVTEAAATVDGTRLVVGGGYGDGRNPLEWHADLVAAEIRADGSLSDFSVIDAVPEPIMGKIARVGDTWIAANSGFTATAGDGTARLLHRRQGAATSDAAPPTTPQNAAPACAAIAGVTSTFAGEPANWTVQCTDTIALGGIVWVLGGEERRRSPIEGQSGIDTFSLALPPGTHVLEAFAYDASGLESARVRWNVEAVARPPPPTPTPTQTPTPPPTPTPTTTPPPTPPPSLRRDVFVNATFDAASVGTYPSGWRNVFSGTSGSVQDVDGRRALVLEAAGRWGRTDGVPVEQRHFWIAHVDINRLWGGGQYGGGAVTFYQKTDCCNGRSADGPSFAPDGSLRGPLAAVPTELHAWTHIDAAWDFQNMTWSAWACGREIARDAPIPPSATGYDSFVFDLGWEWKFAYDDLELRGTDDAATFSAAKQIRGACGAPSPSTSAPPTITTPTRPELGSPALQLTSFQPTSAFPGETIVLRGVGLDRVTSVQIHGVAAAFETRGDKLAVIIPNTATSGEIRVFTTTQDATASELFTVLTPRLDPAFRAVADGFTVTLVATGSQDTGPNAAAYTWEFGDGQRRDGASVEHTYASVGRYDVTLTVTSGIARATRTERIEIVEPYHAPIARFDLVAKGDRGIAVDATGSRDIDGRPLSLTWDFGDGTTGTGAQAEKTYTRDGEFTVRLRANNGRLESSAEKTVKIEVANRPPVASFSHSPLKVVATVPASFVGEAKDPDGFVVSVRWDFGDGTSSREYAPAHTFTDPGRYRVTFTVRDNLGAETIESALVEVKSLPETKPAPTTKAPDKDGDTISDADEEALLKRLRPLLRQHEDERFKPIDPLDYLKVVRLEDGRGKEMAKRPVPPATLENSASSNTYLNILDSSGKDLAPDKSGNRNSEAYAAIFSKAAANVQGRVTKSIDPSTGSYKIVIQFWMFYAYNDWRDSHVIQGADNNHEGDWEMIQFVLPGLDPKADPESATYSRHRTWSTQPWSAVQKVQGHPVVYVARGSHANYFDEMWKEEGNCGIRDYRGMKETYPEVQPLLDDPLSPAWLEFPGRWGQLVLKDGKRDEAFSGPRGPMYINYHADERIPGPYANPIRWASTPAPACVSPKQIFGVNSPIDVILASESGETVTLSGHQVVNDGIGVLDAYEMDGAFFVELPADQAYTARVIGQEEGEYRIFAGRVGDLSRMEEVKTTTTEGEVDLVQLSSNGDVGFVAQRQKDAEVRVRLTSADGASTLSRKIELVPYQVLEQGETQIITTNPVPEKPEGLDFATGALVFARSGEAGVPMTIVLNDVIARGFTPGTLNLYRFDIASQAWHPLTGIESNETDWSLVAPDGLYAVFGELAGSVVVSQSALITAAEIHANAMPDEPDAAQPAPMPESRVPIPWWLPIVGLLLGCARRSGRKLR